MATGGLYISELPVATTPLSGSELVPIVQGGLNKQTTATALNALSSPIGVHAVWVVAGSMTPSFSGGCSPLATIATGTNLPDIQSLDFSPSVAQFAQFRIRMPKSWNGGTFTFVPVWCHGSGSTNFDVFWTLQAAAVGNTETIATAYGTAQSSLTIGTSTVNALFAGPESIAITPSGTIQSQDTIFFRVSRDPLQPSDTLTIDARLIGITVFMTLAAGNDA